MPTNPSNGLTLIEAMTDEQLLPRNNLADLPARATALTNLGLTSTAAELNAIDGVAASFAITQAVGANNEVVVTVTAKDAAGATIAAVHEIELWFSADSAGIGLTGTAYSGSLVASVGALLTTLTAKKHFTAVTAATGIFTGTLTDSAETAAQYCAVRQPLGKPVAASSALVWG